MAMHTCPNGMSGVNKFEPPKCPSCGKGLWTLGVKEKMFLMFDRERNVYVPDEGEWEIFCPECDGGLFKVFPKGLGDQRLREVVRGRGSVVHR